MLELHVKSLGDVLSGDSWKNVHVPMKTVEFVDILNCQNVGANKTIVKHNQNIVIG